MVARYHLGALKDFQEEIHLHCGARKWLEDGILFYISRKYVETKEVFLPVVLLHLGSVSLFFFYWFFIWWGGRAGLMRQIANLLVGLEPARRFESSPHRLFK